MYLVVMLELTHHGLPSQTNEGIEEDACGASMGVFVWKLGFNGIDEDPYGARVGA